MLWQNAWSYWKSKTLVKIHLTNAFFIVFGRIALENTLRLLNVIRPLLSRKARNSQIYPIYAWWFFFCFCFWFLFFVFAIYKHENWYKVSINPVRRLQINILSLQNEVNPKTMFNVVNKAVMCIRIIWIFHLKSPNVLITYTQ